MREVLEQQDADAAARELVRRGHLDPRTDPVVVDALSGFVALRLRLRAADEWMDWIDEGRRGLDRLVHECPESALLQPAWLEETVSIAVDASVLASRLDALAAAFADAVPSEHTGGRPRRLVRNFVYTVDILWERNARPRLTPSVLALMAKAVDPQVDGALWREVMQNVGRLTNPTQPWADLLRAVRSVDPQATCVETFTIRMLRSSLDP